MSAKSVLERWSRETVTHAAYISSDAYGQHLYAPPLSMRARIDHATKLVRNAQGEAVVSSCQIYLSTTLTITVLDRITLPDGSAPLLLLVDRLADSQGQGWMVTLYFS